MVSADEGQYEAPPVFKFIGRLLTRPRAEYSLDVARFISTGYSDYQGGLVFIACLIGGVAFIWGFILLILKFKGKDVGCASGHAFERVQWQSERGMSTDLESHRSSLDNNEDSPCIGRPDHIQSYSANESDEEMMHSPLPSVHSQDSNDSCHSGESFTSIPSRRERRTQICFFLFGSAALLCVPLILIFTFVPLRQASEMSMEQFNIADDVIAELNTNLATIALASNVSTEVASKINLTLTEVCPESSGQALDEFQNTINFFSNGYESVRNEFPSYFSDIRSALNGFEAVIIGMNEFYKTTNQLLWLLPCLLLVFSSFVGTAMFGVLLAWRGDSNEKLQRWLSYAILPLMVIYSVCSWGMAITAGVAVSIGSDSCLYGSLEVGTPANMIEALLLYNGATPNGTFHSLTTAYVFDCTIEEPTYVLQGMKNDVMLLENYLQRELLRAGSAELESLYQACQQDSLQDFFRRANEMSQLLGVVNSTFASSIELLSCSNIRPIYQIAIEEATCSDATAAAASAFLLFTMLGVSTLGMISLRAAWAQPTQEQKVLKEDEVPENMIVDEHEEYLEYIGKFKHEWQEYCGFDATFDGAQRSEKARLEEVLSSNEEQGAKSHDSFAPCPNVFSAPSADLEAYSYSATGVVSFPSFQLQSDATEKPVNFDTFGTRLGTSKSFDSRDSGQALPSEALQSSRVDEDKTTSSRCTVETELKETSELASTENDAGRSRRTPRQTSTSTSSDVSLPSCREIKRLHFFPSSPCNTDEQVKSEGGGNVLTKIKGFHTTKSQRILSEMDELGGEDPAQQPESRPIFPPTAVAKMNQRSPPPIRHRYEFGQSVRPPPSSPRVRQNNTPRRAIRNIEHQDDCAPSSFSSAPLTVDQYPKAYDTDVDDLISPQSTVFSETSSPTSGPDQKHFL